MNQTDWERIGLALWQMTYRNSDSDEEAWEYLLGARADSATDMNSLRALSEAKWVHCGAQRLATSHKYAAAMMATPAVESMREDIHIPWKAFRVECPNGLLKVDGEDFTRLHVGIFSFPDDKPNGVLTLDSDQKTLFCVGSAELLFDEHDEGDTLFETSAGTPDARVVRMAKRLVVGLLYTMQHTNNFRSIGGTSKSPKGPRGGPPKHRVIMVGAPIKVDCRPAVERYLSSSKSAPPSVQMLVRGHYKRQVIGIGRSGRKVIWIEPYWRGPEEAPILVHPYKVGHP